MSIEVELQQYALGLQATLDQKELEAHRKKAKLEDSLATLRVSIDSLGRRRERFATYFDELHSGLICPCCWIEKEVRAEVGPIGGGTDTHDFFRCFTCFTEYSVIT